ncbi:Fc.00g027070.m01.CDS01 [Cosmosporella sp. VM-42]
MDAPLVHKVNATATPLHPYFPLGVAIPTYAANSLGAGALVSIFAAGCALIFLTTHLIIQQANPGLSRGQAVTTMWFVLCGFIHLFFEGYFSYNALDMASQTDLFGQLWKEYSLSDSRYMTQDAFVVCMETITAFFWGPLSFVCAYCIVTDHPLRHPLQLIISLGQFYGDVLYYATCSWSKVVFEVIYCRPEGFYFWAYYFLCNFFWIVIPGFLMLRSVTEISNAFEKVKAAEKAGKKNI